MPIPKFSNDFDQGPNLLGEAVMVLKLVDTLYRITADFATCFQIKISGQTTVN